MKIVRYFILFVALTFTILNAQKNNYYLEEGVKRYYNDPCNSMGFGCVATDFYNLGIETVLEDTLINEKIYHKVLWEWKSKFENDPEKSKTGIEYLRFVNGLLYKYSIFPRVIL